MEAVQFYEIWSFMQKLKTKKLGPNPSTIGKSDNMVGWESNE